MSIEGKIVVWSIGGAHAATVLLFSVKLVTAVGFSIIHKIENLKDWLFTNKGALLKDFGSLLWNLLKGGAPIGG